MTGLSHQLFALLCAIWFITLYPSSHGLILGIIALIAVMVGALTPDLDQPTANIWRRLLGARAIGKIFQSFSGGHRHLTHSIIGILFIGYAFYFFIHRFINEQYIEQALVIWTFYMIGYLSHPIADTFTDHGVPWFWPWHFQIKIPPGPPVLRVTTGSFVELLLVRGGIVIASFLLLFGHWRNLVDFFR